MNLNVILISNPKEFDYEKELIRTKVLPELDYNEFLMDINFIDIFQNYDEENLEETLERAYYNSPSIFQSDYNLFIVCLSDIYGYVPSQYLYDKINYFNRVTSMPKEAISLIEYQARLAGIFDYDSKNKFLVLLRSFTNRPDYPNNEFVEYKNHDRLRDFIYKVEEKEAGIKIGDYNASLLSDSTYMIHDESMFIEGVTYDIEEMIDAICYDEPYQHSFRLNYKKIQESNSKRIEGKYSYLLTDDKKTDRFMFDYYIEHFDYDHIKSRPVAPVTIAPICGAEEKAAIFIKHKLELDDSRKAYIYDASRRKEDNLIDDLKEYITDVIGKDNKNVSTLYNLLSRLDDSYQHYFIIIPDEMDQESFDTYILRLFNLPSYVHFVFLIKRNYYSTYSFLLGEELKLLYPGFKEFKHLISKGSVFTGPHERALVDLRMMPYFHLPFKMMKSISSPIGSDKFFVELDNAFPEFVYDGLDTHLANYHDKCNNGLEYKEMYALFVLLASSRNGVPYRVIRNVYEKAFDKSFNDLAFLEMVNDYHLFISKNRDGNYISSLLIRNKVPLMEEDFKDVVQKITDALASQDDKVGSYEGYRNAYKFYLGPFLAHALVTIPINVEEYDLSNLDYSHIRTIRENDIVGMFETLFDVKNNPLNYSKLIATYFESFKDYRSLIASRLSLPPYLKEKADAFDARARIVILRSYQYLFSTYVNQSLFEKAFNQRRISIEEDKVTSYVSYAETLYFYNQLGIEGDHEVLVNDLTDLLQDDGFLRGYDFDYFGWLHVLVHFCSFKKKKKWFLENKGLKKLVELLFTYAPTGSDDVVKTTQLCAMLLYLTKDIEDSLELHNLELVKSLVRGFNYNHPIVGKDRYYNVFIAWVNYLSDDSENRKKQLKEVVEDFLTDPTGYSTIEYDLITPIIMHYMFNILEDRDLITPISNTMYQNYTRFYHPDNVLMPNTITNLSRYYHLINRTIDDFEMLSLPRLKDVIQNSILEEYGNSLIRKHEDFMEEFDLEHSFISGYIRNLLTPKIDKK